MAKTDIKAKVGLDVSMFNKKLKKLERRLKRSLRNMESAGNAITRSVTLPMVGLGAAAVQSAVKLDQLKKGLTGIMGSADLAAKEFDRLRIIAKDPGMSLQSVVEGSVKLQAIGYDAGKAAEQMKVLGNAIALVGGGGEALSGVTLAMTQILGKGKVHAEEINQMAERLPQIRQAMVDAFGTADTEAIQKMGLGAQEFIDGIIGKLAELPKAQKTLRDQFQHLKDDMMVLGAQLGNMLIPVIFKVVGVIKNLINVWSNFSSGTKNTIVGLVAAFTIGGPLLSGIALFAKGILAIVGNFNIWKLGLTAVATALFVIYKNWDWIKEKIDKARLSFANYKNSHGVFNQAWETTKAKLLQGLEAIKLVGNASANTVGALTNSVWKLTRGDITGAWDAISEGGDNTIHAWKQMTKNIEDIEGMKALNILMGKDAPKKPSVAMGILGEWGKKIKGLTGEARDFMSTLFGGGGSGGGPSASIEGVAGFGSSTQIASMFASLTKPLESSPISIDSGKIMNFEVEGQAEEFAERMEKEIGSRMEAIDFTPSGEALFEGLATGIKNFGDLTAEEFAKVAQVVGDLFSGIQDVVNKFYDNKEQRLEKTYDYEKRLIENSAATEEQKAKKIKALDEKTDRMRRDLARKKAISDRAGAVFTSIINGLVGVSSALAAGNPILAGIIGTIAAANTAAIASQPIPALASGGIVSGDSVVRVGEYPGARANPEVIAPLDKLKGMMGGMMGGLTVNLTGGWRVSGADLETVLDRATVQRKRLTA